MKEATLLLQWAKKNLLSLRAEHLVGEANTAADWLSQQQLKDLEWQLNPSVFQQTMDRFGLPEMELFTSKANTQLPRFISGTPNPAAEGVDALQCPWIWDLLYTFPPVQLLPPFSEG